MSKSKYKNLLSSLGVNTPETPTHTASCSSDSESPQALLSISKGFWPFLILQFRCVSASPHHSVGLDICCLNGEQ